MDASTREEICIHLFNAANDQRERAEVQERLADSTSMADWKEEYERNAITHRKIANALKDLAERFGAGV